MWFADVRTLFSMYLYTLLHVLTVVSAWVGLGQGILSAHVQAIRNREKKPQTNGNTPANNRKYCQNMLAGTICFALVWDRLP